MKRFFRTLAFVAAATVATVSISSCTEEDESIDKKENGQTSGTDLESFYNGLTNPNNIANTIVIDTREASKYAMGHVKYESIEAKSMPLTDDVFYDNNSPFYTQVEALDPDHKKFILITDEGASPAILKIGGKLSSMGWGKERIFILMCATSELLDKHPEVNSAINK